MKHLSLRLIGLTTALITVTLVQVTNTAVTVEIVDYTPTTPIAVATPTVQKVGKLTALSTASPNNLVQRQIERLENRLSAINRRLQTETNPALREKLERKKARVEKRLEIKRQRLADLQ